MTPRSRRCRAAGLVLVAAIAAACGTDRTPRRVPDDGAPCSAMMPGAPEMGQVTFTLGGVTVRERAWGLRPPPAPADTPAEAARYFVRRATLPADAPVRDGDLLDAAAKRVARGLELNAGDGTKPTVAKVATPSGEAIDLRWPTGKLRNGTRLQLIRAGYCEATIMGAATDAEISAFFDSVDVRAGATP